MRLLGSVFSGYVRLETAGGFRHSSPDLPGESWTEILDALDSLLRNWPASPGDPARLLRRRLRRADAACAAVAAARVIAAATPTALSHLDSSIAVPSLSWGLGSARSRGSGRAVAAHRADTRAGRRSSRGRRTYAALTA
ncbi:hypothetical protein SGRI78S_02928 [Streptomyces griseus subsp. griseus]